MPNMKIDPIDLPKLFLAGRASVIAEQWALWVRGSEQKISLWNSQRRRNGTANFLGSRNRGGIDHHDR
jgi:hypothetical protein